MEEQPTDLRYYDEVAWPESSPPVQRLLDRLRFVSRSGDGSGFDGTNVDSTESAYAGSSDRDRLLHDVDQQIARVNDAIPADIREAALDLLHAKDLVQRISDDIETVGLVSERNLGLTLYLVMTSRLLSRPLSAIVHGSSASGKSYSIQCVADLMPPSAKMVATDITPSALFRCAEDALIHRAIISGERRRNQTDSRADATRALREMQSSGVLSKLVPIDGETVLLERYGPIAYVESTTLESVFEEDMNRALPLAVDESEQQNRRILDALATAAAQGNNGDERARVIAVHHALQIMLKRVDVVIPYARYVLTCLPAKRSAVRRVSAHLFGLIKSVALLHQYQRIDQPAHGDEIVASVRDYAIARRLAIGPVGRLLADNLSSRQQELAERLWVEFEDQKFTPSQAAKVFGFEQRNAASPILKRLAEFGVVDQTEPNCGRKPGRWQMTGPPKQVGAALLPPPEEIDRALAEEADER